MKPIKNIYEQIISHENVVQAYRSARLGKRFRNEVMLYTGNLEENLIEVCEDLADESYVIGKYREFIICEPKRRLVMALPFKDRVVQWAVYSVIHPIMSKGFITHTYACVDGRGAHSAVQQLNYWLRHIGKKPGKWYYLKLDISKFFYRVDHDVLLNIFRRKFDDPRLLRLLEKIIRSEDKLFGLQQWKEVDEGERISGRGMPIGNLTSQMFANVYLNELDQHCKRVLQIKHYIRYMDDVIVLARSREQAHEYLRSITKYLNDVLKLDINKKTAIRPALTGIEFVGYKVYGTHIKLRKPTALRIKRHYTHMSRLYADGRIDLDKIKRVIASYHGAMRHCDSYNLRLGISKTFKLKRKP